MLVKPKSQGEFSPKLRPAPLGFFIPFGLAFIAFWFIPLIYGFSISLYEDTLFRESAFVGLKHYTTIFNDTRYLLALKNTVIYTCLIIFTILPLSYLLALLLQKSYHRFKGSLTFCLLLPGLTPPTVLAFLFLLIFNGRYGILNNLFVLSPWLIYNRLDKGSCLY